MSLWWIKGFLSDTQQTLREITLRKVICYRLGFGNKTLLMFWLNALVFIRAKVKKTNSNFILRIQVSKDYFSFPASSSQQYSIQGLSVLHIGWSAPLRVSSGCEGPFLTNSSCPLPWSITTVSSNCWTAMMRRQGGRSNPYWPLTSNNV